ncbi:hypothetical protein DPMN_052805 [Dreissena polymorpha]|uniref:Uncharacterized protein n=1 Tax=Dreissena polymorpha TaxID=45954 RepID=A0A9D4HRM0_DREPO|nr:hypothetical protein DPMN_052805 [Dreissena polymorpha]
MQVLAVGMKEEFAWTSTNSIDGWMEKPSIGSSSVPVANCRICPRDTEPLLPP